MIWIRKLDHKHLFEVIETFPDGRVSGFKLHPHTGKRVEHITVSPDRVTLTGNDQMLLKIAAMTEHLVMESPEQNVSLKPATKTAKMLQELRSNES